MTFDVCSCCRATTFLVVRHGETVWNAQGRWQGWLNSPLNQRGVEQAQALWHELSSMKIDLAFCSDTGRARQTAEILCQGHNIVPVEVSQLRERFYGEYEGLNAAQIEQKLPGTRFKASRDTRESWRPPGGETMAELRDRLRSFFDKLCTAHAGKTLLLVSHSGVVRATDSLCSGQSFDERWHRVPPNCCLFIVQGTSGSSLSVVRDYCAQPEASHTTAGQ